MFLSTILFRWIGDIRLRDPIHVKVVTERYIVVEIL